MNKKVTIPMPPHVSWTVECPILGQIRKCSWDRDHGLTIEGLSGDESTTLVRGLLTTALLAYQKHKVPDTTGAGMPVEKPAPRSPFPAATPDGNTSLVARAVEAVAQEIEKTVLEQPPSKVDSSDTAPRRRVTWSRRKNFEDKAIKQLKELSNGGASILFEDGTGCTANDYGEVVSRQQGALAEQAVHGEACPKDEQIPLPIAVQEEAAPVVEAPPVVETTPVSTTPVSEGEHIPAPDHNTPIDIEALGLTDEMLLSVAPTIKHLYSVKGITRLSELLAICEQLRPLSPAFHRIKDMKKRMRSACIALNMTCTE